MPPALLVSETPAADFVAPDCPLLISNKFVWLAAYVPLTVRLLPSKANAALLVATLLPFKYNTPLAVPPERVTAPAMFAVVPTNRALAMPTPPSV